MSESPLWIRVDDTGALRGFRRRRQRLDAVTRLPAGSACVLMIAADQILERRVTLPEGTHRQRRAVLAFEMDRLTPFRAEDVAWDYTPCPEHRQAVVLRLIPHACVATLAAQALQAGLRPVAVGTVAAERLQLLPMAGPPEPEGGTRRMVLTGLLAALLLCFALVLLLPEPDTTSAPPQPVTGKPAESYLAPSESIPSSPSPPPFQGPVQGRLIGVIITPEMAEVLVQAATETAPVTLRAGDVWQGHAVAAITATQVTFAADGGTLVLDGTE